MKISGLNEDVLTARTGIAHHVYSDRLILARGGNVVEVRAIAGNGNFRYCGLGRGWMNARPGQSLKSLLRSLRRQLMKTPSKETIPYREISFYEAEETGARMGSGREALDLCHHGHPHQMVPGFVRPGEVAICSHCNKSFSPKGPKAPMIELPV